MRNYGQTCYLSSILHLLNITKRISISMINQFPFFFEEGSVMHQLKSMVLQLRAISDGAYEYSGLLETLAASNPQYSETDLDNDCIEAF